MGSAFCEYRCRENVASVSSPVFNFKQPTHDPWNDFRGVTSSSSELEMASRRSERDRQSSFNIRIELTDSDDKRGKWRRKQTEYRATQKLKPEYNDLKKLEALRKKAERAKWTDEQKQRHKEQSRIRQQKYRARKAAAKEAAHLVQHTSKCSTRLAQQNHELEKAKHREYMRKHRAKWSSQKRSAVNRKRMQRYYKEKEQQLSVSTPASSAHRFPRTSTPVTPAIHFLHGESTIHPPEVTPITPISQPLSLSAAEDPPASSVPEAISSSPAPEPIPALSSPPKPTEGAIKKAAQRIKKHLGTGLRSALLLKKLIRTSDKNTKSHLEKIHVTAVTPEKNPDTISGSTALKNSFEKLKPQRNKDANVARRLLLDNISPDKRNIFPRKVRQKKSKDLSKSSVIKSYFETHSIPLPNKKTVSIKTQQQKHVLDMPIRKLYSTFVTEHPECTVSKTLFYKHRPKHVLPFKHFPKFQCLCDICENISLKLKVLQKYIPSESTIRDKFDFYKCLMCECEDDRFDPCCIYMECEKCGPDSMKSKLLVCLDQHLSECVKWKRWENVKRDGKTKKELVVKNGSLCFIVHELIHDCKTTKFTKHIFVAKWQQNIFHTVCNDLSNNTAVVVIDFAENYRCSYQAEIQSAYFAYKQVTVFPAVCYYLCNRDDSRINDYQIFISNDLVHDAHFSHHCQTIVIDYLKSKGITSVIIFSDGAANQFKSKVPFSYLFDLSESMTIQRCFFGSRHGKNPCDAAGGVIKKSVESAVRCGTVLVQSAESFYDYCFQNLSKNNSCPDHIIRRFHFVDGVQRDGPKLVNLDVVPGTRSLHSVKCHSSKLLATRVLSCFCSFCQSGEFASCLNGQYVKDWDIIKFKCNSKVKKQQCKVSHQKEIENVNQSLIGERVEEKGVRFDDNESLIGDRDEESAESFDKSKSCSGESGEDMVMQNENVSNGDTDSDCMNMIGEREIFFCNLQRNFSNCTTFHEIKDLSMSVKDQLSQFPLHCQFPTIVSCKGVIDKIAESLKPQGLNYLFPIVTCADGNCMPRAVSIASYGTDSFHLELRCRAVVEMSLHPYSYLSLPHSDLLQIAVQCPSFHGNSMSIEESVEDIFRDEVLTTAKLGQPLGLWQMMAFANVIKRKISSVYPINKGPVVYQKLYSRTFKPRNYSAATDDGIVLLWTSDREMSEEYWVANHVVPLLPINKPVMILATF